MKDCGKAEIARKARIGIDPVSYCGHHCAYCFLKEECGGCRSSYNVCSFATLFADGECPNVTCCLDKGLDGCHECGELDNCNAGYYSRENEYSAKATALFIRKHGKKKFTETLRRAIENGLGYAQSLDTQGSVQNALRLLESYLP